MTRHSMATGKRPLCVHCGAKYGQRVTHTTTMVEGVPYKGYLEIIRTSPVRTRANGERLYDVDVWDGKSWMGGYEPFCTLRCALQYARKAWAQR